MKLAEHGILRRFLFTGMGLVFIGASGIALAAQAAPDDTAPPPLRTVSKDELARLGASRDVKKRTQTALELMAARLKQAETLRSQEDFDGMYLELGGFHGLMDNTLIFLDASDRDSSKVLNNYKRFEIGLRQFRPQLELIRREVPARYERYIRNLIMYLRDARSKAVEPLFGDRVVPQIKP